MKLISRLWPYTSTPATFKSWLLFFQGIRGNTGDYGNIGETGPKVIFLANKMLSIAAFKKPLCTDSGASLCSVKLVDLSCIKPKSNYVLISVFKACDLFLSWSRYGWFKFRSSWNAEKALLVVGVLSRRVLHYKYPNCLRTFFIAK